MVYVIERLAQRVKTEGLTGIVCVPTSFQSSILLAEHGLAPVTLNACPELDLTIDGADEVDENLELIKGGGGCQTLEKLVAANSAKLVIVADFRKDSKKLGENVRAPSFPSLLSLLSSLLTFVSRSGRRECPSR